MQYIIDRETIVSALYEAGLDDEALYPDYSGRAMYGDTCLGLVVDGPGELLQFALALARGDDSNLDPSMWVGNVRQDGMGLSTIYYWPGVKVAAEEDDR